MSQVSNKIILNLYKIWGILIFKGTVHFLIFGGRGGSVNDVLLTFFKGPTLGEEDSCFSSQNNIYSHTKHINGLSTHEAYQQVAKCMKLPDTIFLCWNGG
jgi:hypothetical protein